jgi:hypothetical protein
MLAPIRSADAELSASAIEFNDASGALGTGKEDEPVLRVVPLVSRPDGIAWRHREKQSGYCVRSLSCRSAITMPSFMTAEIASGGGVAAELGGLNLLMR